MIYRRIGDVSQIFSIHLYRQVGVSSTGLVGCWRTGGRQKVGRMISLAECWNVGSGKVGLEVSHSVTL